MTPYKVDVARRAKAAGQVPLPAGLDPDTIGAAAALFVAQHRRTHAEGPTWREVGAHLHPDCGQTCGPQAPGADRIVPRVHAERIVRALVKAGWLHAGSQPRSLDIGDGRDRG